MGFLTVLVTALTSLKSLGIAGRIGYVVGLALWTFLCLPTTPIELASGFIFPLWMSTLMSVMGKTTGSVCALLLGRRMLKPLISRMLERTSGGTTGSAVHRHLVSELRKRPIQTMSILRAAPLPTPFKIYGLCLFETELVPVTTYFLVALIINTCWSLVWSLTGSSASSLQDAVSGKADTSTAGLVAKIFTIGALFGIFGAFGRFAKAQMQPPSDESADEEASGGARVAESSAAKPATGKRGGAAKSEGGGSSAPARGAVKSPARARARSKSPAARVSPAATRSKAR